MKMENLAEVMDRLTWLKNFEKSTTFGTSPEEREIKSIASVLRIFCVKWRYVLTITPCGGERFVATMQAE